MRSGIRESVRWRRLAVGAVAVAVGVGVAAALAARASMQADQLDALPVGPDADRSGGTASPTPVERPSTSTSPSTSSQTKTTRHDLTSEPQDGLLERDDVYRWLWVDPADLRFLWQDDTGTPYGQLEVARRALEQQGERVVAITNGGIHRPGLIPSGLYVESGEQLIELNRERGSGNFFLQPNGVFWIGEGRAGVDTTESYAATVDSRVVVSAVQSGPMLLIDSQINDQFSETSTSVHRRNAVGVDGDGRVLLILANRAVNLWEMANRCLELGAVDALYLDGTLSRLDEVTADRAVFPNFPVASMIAVVER